MICMEKIRVMRKSVLDRDEMYCWEHCSGYDMQCDRYVPRNRDIQHMISDDYFERMGDL